MKYKELHTRKDFVELLAGIGKKWVDEYKKSNMSYGDVVEKCLEEIRGVFRKSDYLVLINYTKEEKHLKKNPKLQGDFYAYIDYIVMENGYETLGDLLSYIQCI